MSMATAKRKLEEAIRDNYLRNPEYAHPELDRVQMLVSKDLERHQSLRIHIGAQDVSVPSQFTFTGSGEYLGVVGVGVVSQSDLIDGESADRPASDAVCEAVTAMLECVQSFREAMNKPTSGPDDRPVKDIYVHSINLESTQEDVVERSHIRVFMYQIYFRSDDGD